MRGAECTHLLNASGLPSRKDGGGKPWRARPRRVHPPRQRREYLPLVMGLWLCAALALFFLIHATAIIHSNTARYTFTEAVFLFTPAAYWLWRYLTWTFRDK